jgi:hypothetical protein
MSIGLMLKPEPVVDHLVEQGIRDVKEAIVQFLQVARDFDEGGAWFQEIAAAGAEASRAGSQPRIPSEFRQGEFAREVLLV